jgi:ornithine--oxo-acid transaminase
MIGIEFRAPTSSLRVRAHWRALQLARRGLFAQTVVHALFHRHRILTQVSGDHIEVIKLIPPLIIGEREVDRFVEAFDDVMAEAAGGAGLTRQFATTLLSRSRPRRR